MKFNLKKLSKNKTAIIVGIVFLGLFLPKTSHAVVKDLINFLNVFKTLNEATPMSIGQAFMTTVATFAFWFLNWLVGAAAAVFNGILNIGFSSHIDIVKEGWGVTRDFANMFFILFLVIIAFATILRFEKYGVKQLLPKVIIIALLINFSLVICSVIIDLSNIAANFFVEEIKDYTTTKPGGIAGAFADSINLVKLLTPMDCNELSDEPTMLRYPPDGMGPPEQISARQACQESFSVGAYEGASFMAFLVSMTVGTLVMLIAAFALFVGAFMLLARIVIIWFLLMFVPIVFLCYIIPGLQSMWRRWWKSFLKWCFFAPAYAFFLWLAFKIAVENGTQDIAEKAAVYTNMSGFENVFTANPATSLINYGFIIALLIGGMVAAQKFGIYGANTVINVGRKWYGGAKSWAARTTMRPVKATATAAGAGALKFGSKVFGGEETKLGRRMGARATQIKQREEEQPQHKKFAALVKKMSPSDKLKEMETKGIRGFIATKEVVTDSKLAREMPKEKAEIAIDNLRRFGEHEAADRFQEIRTDAIKNDSEQEKVVEKLTQEGNLNKIPALALKDDRLVAAINKFASAVQIDSLSKASPQHGEFMKDTLQNLTAGGGKVTIASITDAKIIDKIHNSYASLTGDIGRMSTAQKIDWAKRAGPDGLKRMQAFDVDVAINIPTAQLKNTLEKMENDVVVKAIVNHLKNTPSAAAHDLATNDPYISNLG